ncbi:MAG: Crp/Fnr family transcriptional regulator [Alphaproteobacteria bacterium]
MACGPERLEAAGVPSGVVTAVLADALPFAAAAGTILFRPGDVCPGYILLGDGRIRVALVGASGREATLYRVGPGELCVQTFQCLVAHIPYTAFGTAESDLDGVMLRQGDFERRLAASDAFRGFLLSQVARRFQSLTQVVELTAFTPIPVRLAAALLSRAEGDAVALTHAALAADIGTAREVVSRQLERFAKSGLVALDRHRIRLLDRRRLRRVAEGEG